MWSRIKKRSAKYKPRFVRALLPVVLIAMLAGIIFPFITADNADAPRATYIPPQRTEELGLAATSLSPSDYAEPETTASKDQGLLNGSDSDMAAVFGMFPWMIPMYSKLKPDAVLNNQSRGQLYNMVMNQPGVTFGTLARALNIAPGTAEYHLRILEREGFIRARKCGKFIRYYPYEMSTSPYTPVQQKILNSLAIEPEQSQTDLADKVGVSKQVVNYNIKQLREFGVLEESKQGTKVLTKLNAESPYSPQAF
jgi:DNA-binding MarR family transcriptional regulator